MKFTINQQLYRADDRSSLWESMISLYSEESAGISTMSTANDYPSCESNISWDRMMICHTDALSEQVRMKAGKSGSQGCSCDSTILDAWQHKRMGKL